MEKKKIDKKKAFYKFLVISFILMALNLVRIKMDPELTRENDYFTTPERKMY